MIAKIRSYQNFMCSTLSMTSGTERAFGVYFLVLAIAPTFLDIFINYEMNLWEWLLGALGIIGTEIIENHSSRLNRTIPVSDRFAVANMLFVFPVYIGGAALVGIWFWIALGAFHRNKKVRTIWYVAIGAMCFVGIWVLGYLLKSMGIQVDFGLSDIPGIFPVIPTMLVGLVFAVVSRIIAWYGSLRLYRGGQKGRRNVPELRKEWKNTSLHAGSKPKVGIWICLTILSVGVLILSIRGVLGEGEAGTVNITTSNPAEYSDWDTYALEHGVDEDFFETENLIFPEHMEEEYIREYYAKIGGKYKLYEEGSGWTELMIQRFMVAALPEEAYQKEKERIAGITVTSQEENGVNQLLRDTEHFPKEAYIAVYEENVNSYEYVLADDEHKQMIYVYSQYAPLKTIPTRVDFRADLNTDVISMRQANTDGKGFSVYSFWDETIGAYFSEY